MLTLRPVEENGKWGAKQRKEYILDKDGNKIRNKSGRGFKSRAVDVNDWNEKGNSRKWRKDLTDTINVVNDRIGLPEYWEHRSFKELGLEQTLRPDCQCIGEERHLYRKRGCEPGNHGA